MLNTLFLAASLTASATVHDVVGRPPPGICGDTAAFTNARVHTLLFLATRPGFPENLKGLASVSPEEIRLLTDDRDASVCRELWHRVMQDRALDTATGRPLLMTLYQVGPYYVAILTSDRPRPAPREPNSRAPVEIQGEGQSDGRVLVFDANLNKMVETRG